MAGATAYSNGGTQMANGVLIKKSMKKLWDDLKELMKPKKSEIIDMIK